MPMDAREAKGGLTCCYTAVVSLEPLAACERPEGGGET